METTVHKESDFVNRTVHLKHKIIDIKCIYIFFKITSVADPFACEKNAHTHTLSNMSEKHISKTIPTIDYN